jgi:DNA-binding beta-propeller fold protein YncE
MWAGLLVSTIATMTLLAGAAAPAPPPAGAPAFETFKDLPLPGRATRFDYLSLDASARVLYLAHMGDGAVVEVETAGLDVLRVATGMPRVRGVLAVPELGRVYACAAGSGEVIALDAASMKILYHLPVGDVDGLDYVPSVRRLFVSDQHGGTVAVISADTFKLVKHIDVGDEVGNTRYDPATGRVLAAEGSRDELVAIDPASLAITGRYPLAGIKGAHGIALDPGTRTAFIAGENNASVCAFDLAGNRMTAIAPVGRDPDVLAVDAAAHLLYVASESGVISVFDIAGGGLKKLAEEWFAPDAHVVGVDPASHLLYIPLQDVGGHPVLRTARFLGK